MFERILCWLGFHKMGKWHDLYNPKDKFVNKSMRICDRPDCYEIEWSTEYKETA